MTIGEWDRRELCPDGTCTGLIGPDGTCKVCGHAAPNWGDERKRGLEDPHDDDDDKDDEDDAASEDDDEAAGEDPIAPGAKAEIGGWSERTLCSDGGCVGVIGEDGTCKVCSRPGTAGAAADADDDDDDDEYDDDDGDEYEDDNDAEEGGDDDELAAVADQLAGVATQSEVASAKELATAAAADAADVADVDDAEDDRRLCPDGGCIGVIGSDGTCKVCGKEAAA